MRKYYPVILLVVSLFIIACNKVDTVPPNFVILQLDDLGYDDLGIDGNKIVSSPNIDSFANASIRFEQFYVNPVCAPSRASLLTGRHFLKTGVSHVHGGKDFLSQDETTIAEVLKSAGYSTGMWGKWHSGHTAGYFPWERGFDEAYMAQLYKHRNSFGKLNGKAVEHNKWADEVITDYAIDFIDRNREKPFFAYLSFLSIHSPLDTPDSLRNKYIEKGLSYNLATIYGMVEHLDFHLGNFLTALDTMGLMENTIIMFMSDNGPAVLNNELTNEDRKIRYVSGMKGHKGNIWENGVRSPLFVKWQGVTIPGIRYDLIDITDIFPTLVRLSGAELPEDMKTLDGVQICDLIQCGDSEGREKVSFNYANRGWPPTDKPWTAEGVLDEYRPVSEDDKELEVYNDQIISARKGSFKLLHKPGKAKGSAESIDDYVLIDILSDPLEARNLYSEMPDVAEEMKELMEDWWQSVLNEPSSFKMPVFLIGQENMEISTILAKGPSKTSEGVISTYAWLTGWKDAGDFAEYSIDVINPGLYEIALFYKGKPNKASVELSSGNSKVSNTIETYDKAIIGSLNLKKGKGILKLSLEKNPKGGEVFSKLERIELRKR